MIKVYATLIESGRKNLNDVPSSIAKKVRQQIISDGYTINDDATVTKE